MNNRNVIIVSLNSDKVSMLLNSDRADSIGLDNPQLDVFVFDTMEVLNGIFMNEESVKGQSLKMEDLIGRINSEFVKVNPEYRNLVRCSEVRGLIDPYLAVVYKEYYSNPSFKRNCKNQIFTNLQPKLRKNGIFSNKSNLIELLVPFLLTEISLFLEIFNTGRYKCIFGFEPEMSIMKSIKDNKYSCFDSFLGNEVFYKQLLV